MPGGNTRITAGTLQASAAGVVPFNTALNISAGGTFALANNNQEVGSLNGAGNITLGSGTLTTGNLGAIATFSGSISDGPAGTGGGLTKTGTGTLTLTGNSTYTGPTSLNSGTLLANDTHVLPTDSATGSGTLTIASTATLGGTGAVGTVISNGNINPGNTGTGTASIGTLSTLGSLTLNASSTLSFNVSNSLLDQLAVGGNLFLPTTANSINLSLTDPTGGAGPSLTGLPHNYALITYGLGTVSSAAFSSLHLDLSASGFDTTNYDYTLLNDTANSSIDLHVASHSFGPNQWKSGSATNYNDPNSWTNSTVPNSVAQSPPSPPTPAPSPPTPPSTSARPSPSAPWCWIQAARPAPATPSQALASPSTTTPAPAPITPPSSITPAATPSTPPSPPPTTPIWWSPALLTPSPWPA